MLIICTVIFIAVFGVMFYSIWKHRKSVGHKSANFHESVKVEIAWTVIPFIIVIGDDEVAGGYVSLKDMSTGQTSNVSTKEAISLIRAKESANNGPSTDPVSA